MEHFTPAQIYGILAAVVGGLVCAVPFFNLLKDLIGKAQEKRRLKAELHLSNTTGIKQIELDSQIHRDDMLNKMIAKKDEYIERLEAKIEKLEHTDNFSRPKMTEINIAMRAVYLQNRNIRNLIERNEKKENILTEIDILDQKLDKVSVLLP